ncbi:hypothetical protein RND81_06G197700 [Saponaria officinalis]|uniref:Uncharacterized protein n=1 Tax=Saponaria officinalis TaxID=3572 RepID=A0AAW1KDT1_SAPOF
MEQLTGNGTTSDKSTKQEEETPLMQQRVVGAEKLKVMVALDESDASFYALNWALKNLLTHTISAGDIDDDSVGLHHQQGQGCMLYLLHVQHSFQNYAYPVGLGLHTGVGVANNEGEERRWEKNRGDEFG